MSQLTNPKTIYLKDYRPADFFIDTVHLHIDLHEKNTIVKCILTLRRHPQAKPNAPLILNGEDMLLQQVILDGKTLSASDYSSDAEFLTIPVVPDAFTLETTVCIQPQDNTKLMGLYKSGNNFCTQCEAHGFRRITYFLDRPDIMARFTTTITADKNKYPMLLSNGNLIETKLLDNHRHWVHWEDPSKKSCYLFALVAGDFDLLEDSFVTQSGRSISLRLYLEKGFKDQGDFALVALKRAMRWDEERFGREYDLDIYMIVAVSDFNMGAMENKGLNIFNTKYILANPRTATDMDYIGIENVIGHEYFHNWSGNRITCRDWFQITLKEGFTVFRDQSFIEDMTSKSVLHIQAVNHLRQVQFTEDAGPLAHPIRPQSYIEVDNFYTNTVYRKGAAVIRMIQTLIGPDLFRKGTDLYFSKYDGQAVTTENFVGAMEEASHQDLTQFKRWYDQAGTPVLDITSHYDDSAKTITLTVTQSCPPTPGQSQKAPFELPLAVGFIDKEGQEQHLIGLEKKERLTNGTHVLRITKTSESFTFTEARTPVIPSLLRDFSAPVRLNYAYTDEELLCLFAHDTDPFARREAGQEFMKRFIFKLMPQLLRHESIHLDERLTVLFRQILQGAHHDHWYESLLLTLPAESYLLQFMEQNTTIDALHRTLSFIKKSLGLALQKELEAVYNQNQTPTYHYKPSDIGRRALKNLSLKYLTATEEKKFYELAYQQLKNSDNMTDQMGALAALINRDCKERDQALDHFYEQWKTQPLIVNKWLSLQAASTRPDTLEKVKKLLKHPAFNINNPNNVYALLCVFGENVISFHAENGEAYRFIAEQVLAIDPKNSQVAARVLQPLTRWKLMDKNRQKMMKEALQLIADTPQLSKAVYEIVEKSLS